MSTCDIAISCNTKLRKRSMRHLENVGTIKIRFWHRETSILYPKPTILYPNVNNSLSFASNYLSECHLIINVTYPVAQSKVSKMTRLYSGFWWSTQTRPGGSVIIIITIMIRTGYAESGQTWKGKTSPALSLANNYVGLNNSTTTAKMAHRTHVSSFVERRRWRK